MSEKEMLEVEVPEPEQQPNAVENEPNAVEAEQQPNTVPAEPDAAEPEQQPNTVPAEPDAAEPEQQPNTVPAEPDAAEPEQQPNTVQAEPDAAEPEQQPNTVPAEPDAAEPEQQPNTVPAEPDAAEPEQQPNTVQAEPDAAEPEQQPNTVPAEPDAVESVVESPVRERRRFPWRWVGAAAVMLAVGTGCAFAVLAPQRTDLPGLQTASDGRYTFAPLTLPTLAPGQAAPTGSANAGQQHVSDIRKLLLAAPEGATADHALPGASGWVSRAATVALLDNPDGSLQLDTDGWRHTAGVAWKTPDGAETKIWLLQFIDADAASDAYATVGTFAGDAVGVNAGTITVNPLTSVSYSRVVKGATATWYGVTQVHDADFVIEYTAPASTGIAPFEQEVDLQSELLQ